MIDIGKELQDAFDDGYRKRDAEIIRCKDCHFCGEIDENGWHCCENFGVGMPKMDFVRMQKGKRWKNEAYRW